MDQTSSETATRAHHFTLESVLELFASEGVLSEVQCEQIRTQRSARLPELKERLRSTLVPDPYVSPLELIACFEIPSRRARREFADETEICSAYSFAARIPFIRIDPLKLDAKRLCSIVSKPFARKNLLVPTRLDGRRLTVAMVNPLDKLAIDNLEDVTGFTIEPVLALRVEILKTINEIFAFEHSLQKAEKLRGTANNLGNLENLVDVISDKEPDASDHHIINAVDLLMRYAFEQRASDIHIEPKRERAVVRLRIDGCLHDTHSIPIQVYPSFLSRIKIMGRLDIAEKRKPQDGRIKTVFKEMEIELRVSTVPVAFGEKLVIRIFDPTILIQDISALGFLPEQLGPYEQLLRKPHGIILVTGPTGSGKTTTLYSSLQHLSSPDINVVTIEDPIEMVHESFNQIAVMENAGVTFAAALRSVLRQDPDIIMVGEIRDLETARYAVQAALTGHLVFSTLHTNTASGAISRLADLGVEPFLIASTVIGVIAQRLLRLICPHCTQPAKIDDDALFLLGLEGTDVDMSKVRMGKGCEKCRKTGYFGRTAALEILPITRRISMMIRDGVNEDSVSDLARAAGVQPLMKAAIQKLLAGETTSEEVLRVIPLVT